MEKREPLCTIGENVNWCSHYGKEYGVCQNIKKKKTMRFCICQKLPMLLVYPKPPL